MLKLFSQRNKAQQPSGTTPEETPLRKQMESSSLYITIIGVSTLVLVVWASLAPIDRIVRVTGKIIPAGRSREIQHLEGGIIASIQTTEGASVKKGEVLLTIDDIAAGADLGEATVKLNAHRLRAARLEAEARGATVLELPKDLKETSGATGEERLFESRREKLEQEIGVYENTIKQQTARLNEIQSRRSKLSEELKIARDRLAIMQDMASRNAASKLEVLESQSRVSSLETQINDAASSLPTTQAAVSESQARIKTVRADFISTAQNELVAARAEIERLEQSLRSASDRVSRTEIRAPVDGIINRIAVNTLGGVVKPGSTLIELIPHTEEILIEARARPQDRGYLRPGLDATVRVSAYDIGEFGVLKSKVTEVSADTMADQRGETYYRVNLLVNQLPPIYQDHVMVPGMTATADIATGSRTVMALLLSPIRKFTYSMFRDSR